MALDDVGGLFGRTVVPLGGCRSQSEEDEENACYPQVHLVKLNLQRQNPVMRRSVAVVFIPLKDMSDHGCTNMTEALSSKLHGS